MGAASIIWLVVIAICIAGYVTWRKYSRAAADYRDWEKSSDGTLDQRK